MCYGKSKMADRGTVEGFACRDELSRRGFLKRLSVAISAAAFSRFLGPLRLLAADGDDSPNDTSRRGERSNQALPKRQLGETGERIPVFGLGGGGLFHLSHRREDAIALLDRALDLGVRYIDTAAQYGDGVSERTIGEVANRRRQEMYLATKTLERTYDGVLRAAERSLERLRVDTIDLYQIHGLRTHDEARTVLSANGAVAAMERLRGEGVVRHIGVTGHYDPEVLRSTIVEHPFDCILLTLNPADPHYRPFQRELLDTAVEKKLGIVAMKIVAKGRLLRADGVRTMREALGYALSFPLSVAIAAVSSVEELEENVEIARRFRPLSDERLRELEELTAHYQREANFFKYEW